MNWISPVTILVVGWLAVFLQTQLEVVRSAAGVPVSVVPALVVYCAFTHGLGMVAMFTAVTGLGADAMSGSRLGLGWVTPFVAGFVLNTRRHLLLREQRYAQFWLGLGCGIAMPLGHAALLHAAHGEPAVGWETAWQLMVLGLINGAACPAFFKAWDGFRRMMEYGPEPTSFQAGQREMKRGRG